MRNETIQKVFYGFLALVVLALIVVGKIEQDQHYHEFADEYPLFGIPNALNVLSNIPFTVIGIIGLFNFRKMAANQKELSWIALWMFLGFTLIGFGSAYYHIDPTSKTLIWDRLPMTMVFMSLFSLILGPCYDERLQGRIFLILAGFGLLSVGLWAITDDLRPYIMVQFIPLVFTPFILIASPRRWPNAKHLWFAVFWYVGAKFCEFFDETIMIELGIISGHTLKHLLAFMAMVNLYSYVKKRLRGDRATEAIPATF